jgi:hypothetical protein
MADREFLLDEKGRITGSVEKLAPNSYVIQRKGEARLTAAEMLCLFDWITERVEDLHKEAQGLK